MHVCASAEATHIDLRRDVSSLIEHSAGLRDVYMLHAYSLVIAPAVCHACCNTSEA